MDKLRWSLFSPGNRVLVAVSGGPDSLSLLHALHTGREEHGLAAVEAAHLDHGLRGAESAAEAAWVAAWCAERSIPCHVGFADVAQMAKARKCSKQEAARAARYDFLAATAATIGADKIATAHTQDDQIETVLLNILRGTGIDGLRGIPVERSPYVRPLLDVSRIEIEAYCLEHSLTPRRDPSNFSPDNYTRNRLRLELLPQLARDYNPAVGKAILRLSEIAARDSDYLHAQAENALRSVTREQDFFYSVLDRSSLAELHPALLRYVLGAAIARLRGTNEGVTYEHLEWVSRAVSQPFAGVGSLTLADPICFVRVTAETLKLSLANVSVSLAYVAAPLSIPGETALPEIGWTVTAGFDTRPGAVALDADAIHGPILTVRNWRFGDKIAPIGMDGHHKKVSDIFTNAKVPRAERHRVPMITDDDGLIWVVGYALAERAKVTDATKRTLYLTATHDEFA